MTLMLGMSNAVGIVLAADRRTSTPEGWVNDERVKVAALFDRYLVGSSGIGSLFDPARFDFGPSDAAAVPGWTELFDLVTARRGDVGGYPVWLRNEGGTHESVGARLMTRIVDALAFAASTEVAPPATLEAFNQWAAEIVFGLHERQLGLSAIRPDMFVTPSGTVTLITAGYDDHVPAYIAGNVELGGSEARYTEDRRRSGSAGRYFTTGEDPYRSETRRVLGGMSWPDDDLDTLAARASAVIADRILEAEHAGPREPIGGGTCVVGVGRDGARELIRTAPSDRVTTVSSGFAAHRPQAKAPSDLHLAEHSRAMADMHAALDELLLRLEHGDAQKDVLRDQVLAILDGVDKAEPVAREARARLVRALYP